MTYRFNKIEKKSIKFLLRFTIIFLMQLNIKSWDYSFPKGPFEISFRSAWFSLFFIGYWLIVWWLADSLNKQISQHRKLQPNRIKKIGIVSFFEFILAFGSAILYNFIYWKTDVLWFDMYAQWEPVPFPHSELMYPLAIFFLLIYTGHQLNSFSNDLTNAEMRAEKIQKEAILAQYNELKTQVDPHFLFNSLSVLSSLINKDTLQATQYVEELSKLYRHTLTSSKDQLVPIAQELDYLNSYIYLINIRHEHIKFEINLSEKSNRALLIPPNTLQLLFENAVKHNQFTRDEPLVVELLENKASIIVRNNFNPRKVVNNSTGMGLENIIKRFELIGFPNLRIENNKEFFEVHIPKIENHA